MLTGTSDRLKEDSPGKEVAEEKDRCAGRV